MADLWESNSVKLFKDHVKSKQKRKECSIKVAKKDNLELLIRNACYLFESFFFFFSSVNSHV